LRLLRHEVLTGRPLRYSPPLLELCAKALSDVTKFLHPADAVLSAFYRAHRQAGQQDRSLIAETVYAALRRWRLMEAIAPGVGLRKLTLAVWASQLNVNVRELEPLLQRGEREWLGGVKSAAREEHSFAVECDLPDWVITALRRRFDDAELLRHARAFQQPAPLDLRANLFKCTRESALATLAASGITAKPTPYSPAGIRVSGKPAINREPLFVAGDVEVQDEGSQLLAWLVDPKRGEMVVDFCAGAGGKTLAMGMLMRSTGRLYAFDISAKRLENLKPRLARSGLSNVHPQRIEGERDARIRRLAGKIDRVLVDSPCSGLGTLRRNPDLKVRQSQDTVRELRVKQGAILSAAAPLLKPGGRLVYATCSILPEENQDIVRTFLDSHPQFALRPAGDVLRQQKIDIEAGEFLELWPATHQTDGFFAAVLEREK
jgi:16S rRNA (cytosine967-C5)-methyltransferase